MTKIINRQLYQNKHLWECRLTTVGGEQAKDELWEAFAKDTKKRIKIHGIDINNLDDLEILERWLNGFIINLNRPLMALDETEPGKYTLQLFLIKNKDPENYYRIASNLEHNLTLGNQQQVLRSIDKLINLAINNFNPISTSRLALQKRQRELHQLLSTGEISNIRITPLMIYQNDDNYRNGNQQVWYLSRTRGLLVIEKMYKKLNTLAENYGSDLIDAQSACAGHLIDKFVAKYDTDTYMRVMEINHSNSSNFSLPVVYQHKYLGIHGRTSAYYLYNVISRKVNSAHYVLTNLRKMRELHFTPKVNYWRLHNEELLDEFLADYFSRREMDERLIEIEKVRTYEPGESIITMVQRGRYHYYYEVVLEPEQKEMLRNGGEPDGIL